MQTPKAKPKRVDEKFSLPDSFKPDFHAREVILVAFGVAAFRNRVGGVHVTRMKTGKLAVNCHRQHLPSCIHSLSFG